MLKYKQFFESKATKFEYSKTFYLKKYAESKSGKSALYGFEIKKQKYQIWIPIKAVYKVLDNDLSNFPEFYKRYILAHFIYNPDTHDDVHDKRIEFFKAYDEYMVPIINKQLEKKEKEKEDKIQSEFKEAINKIVPGVIIDSFDSKSNIFKTNIGDFYIYNSNPITFKIGDVFLTMEEGGINLNYANKFYIKLLGKDGLVGKALIKINSNQTLNAVEIMAIKRIYTEELKKHDWYYNRSDDSKYYKAGLEQAKRISNLKEILIKVGQESFSKQMYDQYSKQ